MRFLPSRCCSYSSSRIWIDHGNWASEFWTWFRPVHAHGIGGAAGFLDRGQHGDRFLGRGVVVVGGRRGLVHEQRLCVGCLLVHLDAHVVDHGDDVFQLLGIDDVVRQVVVHFGIRQEPLLLPLGDELLDLGLLLGLERIGGHRGILRKRVGQYRRGVKEP